MFLIYDHVLIICGQSDDEGCQILASAFLGKRAFEVYVLLVFSGLHEVVI